MRFVRLMQTVFLALLLLVDLFIGSILSDLGSSSIVFISSLHFLGLIILSQNDTFVEGIVKVVLISVWMDLNHVNSFPVFLFSYMISYLLMYRFKSYIGSTSLEFTTVAILTLFIKEVLMYCALVFFKSYQGSLINFFAYRSFWVILGNLLFIPFVVFLHKQMHRYIMQRAQNLYMR